MSPVKTQRIAARYAVAKSGNETPRRNPYGQDSGPVSGGRGAKLRPPPALNTVKIQRIAGRMAGGERLRTQRMNQNGGNSTGRGPLCGGMTRATKSPSESIRSQFNGMWSDLWEIKEAANPPWARYGLDATDRGPNRGRWKRKRSPPCLEPRSDGLRSDW